MKDSFGREINYLRLSVTDRCNFRCQYCMPEEGIEKVSHDDILTYEEILKLIKAAANLGIDKVRLTGGEPLTRKDLPKLIKMISGVEGIQDLSMTTNGSRLGKFADDLAESGLDRVNISLDSVDPELFEKITRGGNLDSVLSGIEAAQDAGLDPVKLNTVIMKGVNDSEVNSLVEYAVSQDVVLRFIELMPMGEAADIAVDPAQLEDVRRVVEREWELERVSGPKGNGPAEYYSVEKGNKSGRIGFIFPISHNFCDGCNRIRITSRGNVRPCLARDEQYELNIEKSTTTNSLQDQLREIIEKKPHGHRWEDEKETSGEMSEIGG
jgi:cyclic pyranopterin phosphate synthase